MNWLPLRSMWIGIRFVPCLTLGLMLAGHACGSLVPPLPPVKLPTDPRELAEYHFHVAGILEVLDFPRAAHLHYELIHQCYSPSPYFKEATRRMNMLQDHFGQAWHNVRPVRQGGAMSADPEPGAMSLSVWIDPIRGKVITPTTCTPFDFEFQPPPYRATFAVTSQPAVFGIWGSGGRCIEPEEEPAGARFISSIRLTTKTISIPPEWARPGRHIPCLYYSSEELVPSWDNLKKSSRALIF